MLSLQSHGGKIATISKGLQARPPTATKSGTLSKTALLQTKSCGQREVALYQRAKNAQ